MHARGLPRVGPLLAALMVLASFGCQNRLEPTTRPEVAGDPSGTGAGPVLQGPAQPGFYPLVPGSRWLYADETVYRFVPNSGWEPPPERYLSTIDRRILEALVDLNGRSYLAEEALTSGEFGTFRSVTYHRQDASGFYEWAPARLPDPAPSVREALERIDLSGRPDSEREVLRRAALRLAERVAEIRASIGRGPVPHDAPPGTASPDELTLLRYPLALKSRWAVREGLFFGVAAEVVGTDELELPPGRLRGFRIRLVSGAAGPRDFVHVWYGTSGFLQLVGHYESDTFDQNGEYVGRYVFDERVWLYELSLARPTSPIPIPPWVARPIK